MTREDACIETWFLPIENERDAKIVSILRVLLSSNKTFVGRDLASLSMEEMRMNTKFFRSIRDRDFRRNKATNDRGLLCYADKKLRELTNNKWRVISLSNGIIATDDKSLWEISERRLRAHSYSESVSIRERTQPVVLNQESLW